MTCRTHEPRRDRPPNLFRRIFGGPKNAPYNVAAAVLVLTFVVGLVGTVFYPKGAVELWAWWFPIITLVFGYLMGKNARR